MTTRIQQAKTPRRGRAKCQSRVNPNQTVLAFRETRTLWGFYFFSFYSCLCVYLQTIEIHFLKFLNELKKPKGQRPTFRSFTEAGFVRRVVSDLLNELPETDIQTGRKLLDGSSKIDEIMRDSVDKAMQEGVANDEI